METSVRVRCYHTRIIGRHRERRARHVSFRGGSHGESEAPGESPPHLLDSAASRTCLRNGPARWFVVSGVGRGDRPQETRERERSGTTCVHGEGMGRGTACRKRNTLESSRCGPEESVGSEPN